jgi:hypothetical protein
MNVDSANNVARSERFIKNAKKPAFKIIEPSRARHRAFMNIAK